MSRAGVEQDNHFPHLASNIVFDAPQNDCPFWLLGHTVDSYSIAFNQILICGAALQLLVPQSVCTLKVALCQLWNPTLALVKLHILGDCSAV